MLHCNYHDLRKRKIEITKIWFINGVDNVNWPPYRDWKADVSSVSPSSEQIQSNPISDLLWRRANAWNISFSTSVPRSIYIINSVDKPNFRVSLPHRCSTTVSSETNPLYSKIEIRPIELQTQTTSDPNSESLKGQCCKEFAAFYC